MKLHKKFYFVTFYDTGQTAQAIRRSLLVREVWGFKSSATRCQRITAAATLEVWALVQSGGDGYRPLVTPQRVISEHNDFFIWLFMISCYTLDPSEEK